MISVVSKNYIPLTLVFINVFIKSFFLTNQPISHDEPFTIYHAQFDLYYLLDYLKNYNNPPLYEIILHFWIKGFGISELSVRILPMIFSSLTVFFIFKIGEKFYSLIIAISSSLLFTFSTMQIWYAHDSRVYSLFLLLTVISFYLFFILLEKKELSTIRFFFFTLVNVLLLYAHYFGVFVWLIEWLIIMVYCIKNKQIIFTFFKVSIVGSILFLPHVFVFLTRFSESAQQGTWLNPPNNFESLYNMIWSFTNAPVVAVSTICLLVFCGIKFLFFTTQKTDNPFVKYAIWWFLFPYLFMFFISYKVPMFLDRYLIYITPALYLLIPISISFLFKTKKIQMIISALFVVLFASSVKLNPDKKRLTQNTVNYIKLNKTPSTIVLGCSPDFMTNFAYYYNREYFKSISQNSEYGKLNQLLQQDNVFFINQMDSKLISKISNYNKIIYLDAAADFSFPNNQIKFQLMQKYKLLEQKDFFEIFHVYIFSKTISPN